MKPPFAYAGGKMRLADRIVSLMPAHGHYVEPFAGSLSVLLAKPLSPAETVNDVDGDLVCFWRVLRDQTDDLVRICAATPHSRRELERARETPRGVAVSSLERARRTWVRISQSRGGTLRTTTGWRFYAAMNGVRNTSMPDTLRAYVDRMETVAQRLSHVSLECDSYEEVLERYDDCDTLFYCDPPYLGSTRSTWHYAAEMRSEAEHVQLLDRLNALQGMVLLSGYPSPLYEKRLSDWQQVTFRSKTQNRHATEVVWLNPAAAERAPQADLLGGA